MVRNTRQISFWHKTCINKGQDTVAAGVVLFHFLPWVCRSKVLLLLLSRFSRVWLCDPRDGSPPGSPIPGILQARTLEWVAISSSNAWKWKVKVKSLSRRWALCKSQIDPLKAQQGVGAACINHTVKLDWCLGSKARRLILSIRKMHDHQRRWFV